jgi:hypothetical protein
VVEIGSGSLMADIKFGGLNEGAARKLRVQGFRVSRDRVARRSTCSVRELAEHPRNSHQPTIKGPDACSLDMAEREGFERMIRSSWHMEILVHL